MSDKDNPYMQEQVAKHGTKPTNGKVLCFFPASGTARRFRGTFFVMQNTHAGATFHTPAVLLPDNTPLAIDARSMVFDDGTLAVLWHPRAAQAALHPAAVKWFEANPDVFTPGVGNGVTPDAAPGFSEN